MPSRDRLRAFVNHVRTLTQKDENGDDGFDREYKSIRDLQLRIKDSPEYPTEDGRLPCNKKKNRYKDILPFDFCRVALTPTEEVGSDYINASFLQDINGENGYIAAMGPLTATVDDYWRMLWEYGIKTIVMVCKEVELGKKKCAKYWADLEEPVVCHAGVTIRVVEEGQQCEEITVRQIDAEYGGEHRRIFQYHFQSWPDHGVPETAQPIVDLIQIFRKEQPTNSPPIVVHCSAGCGRTGTVCAVDYAWQLLESQIESDVSVLDIVTLFRHQRLSMVQTKDQYVLIYKAVLKLVKSYLASRSKASLSEVPRALPEPTPVPPEPVKEDLYQNVTMSTSGMAYGEQATNLEPKKESAPPIPPTKRLSPTGMPVTSIDDFEMTAEDQEEEKRLQMEMSYSMKRRGSLLCAYPREGESDGEEEPPPPIPEHTDDSFQLEDSGESAVDARFAGTSDGAYTVVSPSESRRESRTDLQAAGENDEPPPLLPTRTEASYILTEEERAEKAAAAAAGIAGAPQVPATPRPSQAPSTTTSGVHLRPGGSSAGSACPLSSTVNGESAPGSRSTTPGAVGGSTGGLAAGSSATLPALGRTTSPPSSSSALDSGAVSGLFTRLKGGIKRAGGGTTVRSHGDPHHSSMTISSPMGIGGSGGDEHGQASSSSLPRHAQLSSHTVGVFSDDMGFNNRVPRPKGPRNMPSTWRSFA